MPNIIKATLPPCLIQIRLSQYSRGALLSDLKHWLSTENVRKITKVVLVFATLSALFFVLFQFYKQWPAISKWHFSSLDLIWLAASSLIYAGAIFLLAGMWYQLLRVFHEYPLDTRTACGVYARTQIAKYIPGNIFQFAGRHLYLTPYGYEHAVILKVTLIEILLMLTAAATIALLSISKISVQKIYLPLFLAIGITILCIVALAILSFMKLPGRATKKIRKGITLLIWPLAFFIAYSMIFAGLGKLVGWEITRELIFAATVSWGIGFVLPGAPGGLGVREFVLFFFLKDTYPASEVLIVLALFRVTTTLGDLICFAIGTRLKLAEPIHP